MKLSGYLLPLESYDLRSVDWSAASADQMRFASGYRLRSCPAALPPGFVCLRRMGEDNGTNAIVGPGIYVLTPVTFAGADLTGLRLDGAYLDLAGIDWTGADIPDGAFAGTTLVGTSSACPSALPPGVACLLAADGQRVIVGPGVHGVPGDCGMGGREPLEGTDLSGTDFEVAHLDSFVCEAVHLRGCPSNLSPDWTCRPSSMGTYLFRGNSPPFYGYSRRYEGEDLNATRWNFFASNFPPSFLYSNLNNAQLTGGVAIESAVGSTFRQATFLLDGRFGVGLSVVFGPGSDWTGASIRSLEPWRCDGLGRTKFSGDLEHSRMVGIVVNGVDVQVNASDSNLSGAVFQDAEVVSSNFDRSLLRGVDFGATTIRDTSFVDADLSGADLSGVEVVNGNFMGADLRGANFEDSLWTNCTCPDGTRSNDNGHNCHGHWAP